MIVPIRCFTCGNLIADKWDEYLQLLEQEIPPSEIFNRLDLDRYCCRRMLIAHVDLIEDVMKFTRQQ
ncbi:DNA-directed RNA polymerase subunit N [Candidatus Bathyarchaeota archaeon]|nr:DNA-directed RNA polymerase subunit N [Candidatus Bathyarchaeota archaeon]